MAKIKTKTGPNNDLQNIAYTTKDREKRTILTPGVNSGAPKV